MRGCVFAFFVAALLTGSSRPVKADLLLFWNFDEYTTEGGVNYVTDTVHSERLKLVNSSIVDGQLSANGGYAQGTGTNNGTGVALPTKTSSYTLSAFLTTTRNGSVGIMSWGVRGSTDKTNSFRTDGAGLKNYWWGDDLAIGGYPEVYSGSENYVVATGSGRTQTLYLNGQLIGTRNAGGDRNEENRAFFVGNTINNNTETLYGSIDNASVYNDAMEHSDIVNIAAHTYNGLTNWWKANETIDRVGGVVKPATVTGTTVINGTSGQVMVFNRVLTAGEQAYYEGQLAAEHEYVIDNMAGSASTKTTWLRTSSANLSDAPETPLGIYVGGTTTEATLTATLDQINAVNRTLVMGCGTLALTLSGDTTIDLNRINFNRGSLSLSGTGKMTIEPKQRLPLSNLAIPTDNSVVFNTDQEVDIYGIITGAGSLTKNGTGDLLVTSKSQSYSGVITLNGGSLTFGLQDAFGWADRAPYCSIVADNATITNNAAVFNALNNTTFKNGAKLVAADGQGTWKAYMLFGTTKVAFSGDGSTAEKPVVFEVASTATGNARTNATICPYGTTFDVADITKSDAADLVVSAVLANTNGTGKIGSFTKTGAGTMELSGANTYTGTTTVSGGKLNIKGSAFASRLIINGGASATIDAGETGVVNMSADGYNSSVMIGNGSSGSLTLNSGNVTIHNSGSGTLGSIQLGTNSDTTVGELTINGGTMQVDGRILIAANKSGAQGTLTMNGGQLTLGVPGSYTTSGDPACGVLWLGAGTSTVNLNGGTVSMFGMNNNGPKAGSTFNFNGGTLQAVGDTTSFLTEAGSMNFYVKQGGAIFDTNGHNVTVSAKLEQGTGEGDAAGKLTKKGVGTLTLSNRNNSFTGNIVVDEGILKASGGWAGGTSGTTVLGKNQARTITINEGGTLSFASQDVVTNADHTTAIKFIVNGGTITNEGTVFNNLTNTEFYNGAKIVAANGNGTWKAFMLTGTNKVAFAGDGSAAENPVVFEVASTASGAALTNATICPFGAVFEVADITKSDASDLVISAVLANTNGTGKIGSFTKTGAGTMELTAANTYTGKTTISAGTLKLTGDALTTHGQIVVESAGTLEFNPGENQTQKLTIDTTNPILGAGQVNKIGEGTLKIDTAQNCFDVGKITVSAGRLDLLGSTSGGLTVGDAAFSPGNSIGTAKVGAFTLSSENSSVVMEIGGATPNENDLLLVSGGLTLNDGLIYLEMTDACSLGLGEGFTAVLSSEAAGYAPVSDFASKYLRSDVFTELDYVKLTEGDFAGLYAITGRRFNANEIPEPSAWVILLLGTFGLLCLRKRGPVAVRS